MPFRFGDVVLIPFPFTDQTALKKRPAVVVSGEAYNLARSDLVVMAITSQMHPASRLGEVYINAWRDAGLLKPSAIKPVVATIERRLVTRRLGTLGGDDQAALKQALIEILG
jgi:mRNA-degrading endonuclease toxin of MazEF toxin-antitoxin module